jgi:hypothetical protein
MLEPEQNVYWSRETGYLPTTWTAVAALEREGHFERQPNAKVALKQLDVAMPWPWSAQLFRVQREVVQPLLEDAVIARRDARVTLERARQAAAPAASDDWVEAARLAPARRGHGVGVPRGLLLGYAAAACQV